MSNLAPRSDIMGHGWWPRLDPTGEQHIWTCTCRYVVVQAFGAPVPDELISHPQEHGQLRGHDLDDR